MAVRNGIQARLRTDFDARFAIRTEANAEALDRMLDYGALQTRYRYGSGDTVSDLKGQQGTRFPHAWIMYRGQRCSTLDLVGTAVVSIGGPLAPVPESGVLYRAGTVFPFVGQDVTWSGLTGRRDDEMLAIRPDGVVALQG